MRRFVVFKSLFAYTRAYFALSYFVIKKKKNRQHNEQKH